MELTKNRILLFFVSAMPFVLASIISAIIVDDSLIGEIAGTAASYSPLDIIVQATLSTVLGAGVVFSLFWVMNRRGRNAKKVVVALVVSPILFFVSIFLGQAFLLILFKGVDSVLSGILLTISLGVSMISIVLIVIDAIPRMLRNVFVAFYGSIFGIFMGVTIVTASMFVMVFSLIVEDYFLTRYSPAPPQETLGGKIGEDPFDYTRIETDSAIQACFDPISFSRFQGRS